MSDATAPPEHKAQPSLFTRVRAVEAELETMKALVAGLAEDHDALRKDRDEWRWRAELLLAERKEEFLDRWGRRIAKSAKAFARRLNALRPARELGGPSTTTLLRVSRPELDKLKDHGAVTLAGLPHRSHAVNHSRLDLDKALITSALHGPSR